MAFSTLQVVTLLPDTVVVPLIIRLISFPAPISVPCNAPVTSNVAAAPLIVNVTPDPEEFLKSPDKILTLPLTVLENGKLTFTLLFTVKFTGPLEAGNSSALAV